MARSESNNLFDVLRGKSAAPPAAAPTAATNPIRPPAAVAGGYGPVPARRRLTTWTFWTLCLLVYSAALVSVGMWIERGRSRGGVEGTQAASAGARLTLRVAAYGATAAEERRAKETREFVQRELARRVKGFRNDMVFVRKAVFPDGSKATWICISQFTGEELENDRKAYEAVRAEVRKLVRKLEGGREERFKDADFLPLPPTSI